MLGTTTSVLLLSDSQKVTEDCKNAIAAEALVQVGSVESFFLANQFAK